MSELITAQNIDLVVKKNPAEPEFHQAVKRICQL